MEQNNKGGNPTLLVGSLTPLTNTNIRKNTVTACPMQGLGGVITCWSKLHCTNMLLGKIGLRGGRHLHSHHAKYIHFCTINIENEWVADTVCFHSS
jgi:hypothetical protein